MNYRILGNMHKYSCQHYSWQQKVETIQRAIRWITDKKKNHTSTQRISQLEDNAECSTDIYNNMDETLC